MTYKGWYAIKTNQTKPNQTNRDANITVIGNPVFMIRQQIIHCLFTLQHTYTLTHAHWKRDTHTITNK